MTNHDAVTQTVSRFLDRAGPGAGSVVLAAYSGGIDSTVLLAALVADGRYKVRAIHVVHGLRPPAELEGEVLLVRRVSGMLGVPLTIARISPGAVARRAGASGSGIEAAARAFRYDVFDREAVRHGAGAVFLGHNADDQAETILMRALGGSGAAGLRGIPASRVSARSEVPFLRPILELRRGSLSSWLEERGIPHSEDSTNASALYARNALRHGVLPVLDRHVPGWRAGLFRMARKACLDEDCLGRLAEPLRFRDGAPGLVRESGAAADASTGAVASTVGAASAAGPASLAADFAPFAAAHPAIRIRALVEGAGRLLSRDRFSWAMAAAMAEALASGSPRQLGGGLDVSREGSCLVMRPLLDFGLPGGYFIWMSGPGPRKAGKWRVSAEWDDPAEIGEPARRDGATFPVRPCLREGSFSFPVVVRSRRPGDALATESGTKRIDDLLAEWNTPHGLRDAVPVVEDRDGIVCVLESALEGAGLPHARFRSSESTSGAVRHLRISVKGATRPDGQR